MTTSQDHRIEVRLDIEATIFLELLSSESDILMCHSLDLSANGLQVMLDDPVEAGSICRLCIDIKDRDPIYLIAEVKWQRPDKEEDATRIGFAIFESDESDILQWKKLVAELLSAAA